MYLPLIYGILIMLPFMPISKKYLFQTDSSNTEFVIFMDIQVNTQGNNKYYMYNNFTVDIRLQNELNTDSKVSRNGLLGNRRLYLDDLLEMFYTFDDFVDDLCTELRVDKVKLMLRSDRYSFIEDFVINDKLDVIDVDVLYGIHNPNRMYIPDVKSCQLYEQLEEESNI